VSHPRSALTGVMMDRALLLTRLLERAGTLFPAKAVVTRLRDGSLHRQTWSGTLERVRRLAGALTELGVRPGDRVATLAWNTSRHLELYFAVPAVGAVLHTLNVRLAPGQLTRIARHAGDRVLFADPEFAVAARDLRDAGVEGIVALDGPDDGGANPRGWLDYEALLAASTPVEAFPEWDENQAAVLCYTSGTTDDPKGVLYSHRALALHTLAIALPDGFGLGEADVIMPAVPMFHANAWGLPFAAAMTGATLVLPGARPDGAALVRLMASEGVTFAAGVPTVWLDVLEALRGGEARPGALRRIHSGGAPTPRALVDAYREEWGVEVVTGWGMTELSPVGMVCHPRGFMAGWDQERLAPVRTSQGTPLPFVEVRIVSEDGAEVPRDGETPGELQVRGPWVAGGYFAGEGEASGAPDGAFRDGWLRTGDVATLDAHGYVRLVDRLNDLIRSGGEWISSVRIENALMCHPAVAEAAVVAVVDVRWQERPLACIVLRTGAEPPSPEELLADLRAHVPSWWLPDRVVFLDALPHTATGKFDKKELRARFSPRPAT